MVDPVHKYTVRDLQFGMHIDEGNFYLPNSDEGDYTCAPDPTLTKPFNYQSTTSQ